MSVTSADIWQLITYIQDDLRQTQGKLVTLRTMLATVDLPTEGPPQVPCPVCGVLKGAERQLAEHLENVHGEPAPTAV